MASRSPRSARGPAARPASSSCRRVSVVIPALNEESSLPLVLGAIPPRVTEVIVVDNGSTDATAEVARRHGARVVTEPRRGYGSACLAGVAAADRPDVIVFMDGDFSDDPAELPILLAPIQDGRADLVIGSRVASNREPSALLAHARLGNVLAGLLIRLLLRRTVTDLGPFRAVTTAAWEALQPDHAGFGLPVQLQARALARGFRVVEVPVSYRRRLGRSKISGTLGGSILAGWDIITTILAESARRPRAG